MTGKRGSSFTAKRSLFRRRRRTAIRFWAGRTKAENLWGIVISRTAMPRLSPCMRNSRRATAERPAAPPYSTRIRLTNLPFWTGRGFISDRMSVRPAASLYPSTEISVGTSTVYAKMRQSMRGRTEARSITARAMSIMWRPIRFRRGRKRLSGSYFCRINIAAAWRKGREFFPAFSPV